MALPKREKEEIDNKKKKHQIEGNKRENARFMDDDSVAMWEHRERSIERKRGRVESKRTKNRREWKKNEE